MAHNLPKTQPTLYVGIPTNSTRKSSFHAIPDIHDFFTDILKHTTISQTNTYNQFSKTISKLSAIGPSPYPPVYFYTFSILTTHRPLSLPVLMDMQEQDQNQLNLELTDEIAEGHYCNLAMIAHSNAEFVLDFIRMMPGLPKARVKSRIVMTPEHAVRFVAALQENIARYESAFGTIKSTPDGQHNMPFNFGGTVGQA